jgi:hypothetical protein
MTWKLPVFQRQEVPPGTSRLRQCAIIRDTQDVVRGHLVGDHTVGIYPLLQDETCWLLAVDFDKKTWQKDAAAFLVACREMNVPAVLERSRSGNGGHVWIFFSRSETGAHRCFSQAGRIT